MQLSVQDIEAILDSLVYDDKIEKVLKTIPVESSNNKHDEEIVCEASTSTSNVGKSSSSDTNEVQNLYRITKPLFSTCGLTKVPCGVCPVSIELFLFIMLLCLHWYYVMYND